MCRQALALLILGLIARPLVAQVPYLTQPLDSGTVVRLGWRAGPARIGKLLAPLGLESDTVVYCRYPGVKCAAVTSSRPEIGLTRELWSVEVRHGERTGRGAVLGAAVGLGTIGLGRWAFADPDSPAPWTAVRVAGAVSFVALAAGIGALIGHGAARWEPAP